MSWHYLPELVADSLRPACSDGAPSAPLRSIQSAAHSSCSASAIEPWIRSLSGTTSAPSTADRGAEPLTSSPVDSPANHSAMLPVAGTLRPTSGPKCSGSSTKSDLASSSRRTCDSIRSSVLRPTSTSWVTLAAASSYRRQTWVLTTFGNDTGWLATPTRKANWAAPSMAKWPGCRNAVRTLGPPSRGNLEYLMGLPLGWLSQLPLETCRFQSWLRSHGEC